MAADMIFGILIESRVGESPFSAWQLAVARKMVCSSQIKRKTIQFMDLKSINQKVKKIYYTIILRW